MSGSKASRRVSEFVGVALFAAALIWIVSLASYDPADAAWFFSTGSHSAPANFAGRVGAFLAELSFQLFGYAAYMIPAAFVIIGWTYFWCRSLDAPGTKATGAALLVAAISTLLSLVFGTVELSGKPFRAGGYTGEFLAKEMSEYLARTGSLIVILTLIFLALIMSTQLSLGRLFAVLLATVKAAAIRSIDSLHERREERREPRVDSREHLILADVDDPRLVVEVVRERKLLRVAASVVRVAVRVLGGHPPAAQTALDKPAQDERPRGTARLPGRGASRADPSP